MAPVFGTSTGCTLHFYRKPNLLTVWYYTCWLVIYICRIDFFCYSFVEGDVRRKQPAKSPLPDFAATQVSSESSTTSSSFAFQPPPRLRTYRSLPLSFTCGIGSSSFSNLFFLFRKGYEFSYIVHYPSLSEEKMMPASPQAVCDELKLKAWPAPGRMGPLVPALGVLCYA